MKTCPYCYRELQGEAEEAPQNAEELAATTTAFAEEELISRATKEVIKAVLEHIQPLLDKLKEAHPDQQTTAVDPLFSAEQHKLQLEQIQQAAKERMQRQEQHLAAKLQKLQARFNRR